MTRRLRALNRGRLAVWWVTHRQDAIRSAQLTTLVVLLFAASTADYNDQLAMAEAERARAEERAAAAEGLADNLPRVTFVIQAATREELDNRLADVASAAGGERYRYKFEKK